MNSKLIICLALAIASVARAGFNPVALTPGSYTVGVVVGTNTPKILPYCITATSGDGTALGDYTYFEQTYYAPAGQTGGNAGVPLHNTVFTNISDANVTFQMPPSYVANNDLQIDSGHGSATLTFTAQPSFSSLAILAGGSAASVVNYTLKTGGGVFGHTFSGTLNLSDWFNPTNGSSVAQIAWGANGRVSDTGGIEIESTNSANNAAPYLYCYYISFGGPYPVETIQFSWSSGTEEANFYGVSGSTDGIHYAPIAVTGFNQMTTVPAFTTNPVTATVDNGTNIHTAGNTWFEEGYYPTTPSNGLPHSASQFTSASGHAYQMGSYAAGSNNAVLIDSEHLAANITPAVTTNVYTAFTLLAAGSYIGTSGEMTNLCVVQHKDGVNETNQFISYDWLNASVSAAWNANGRFYLDLNPDYGSSFNTIGTSASLFENFIILSDTNSPVTNILVKYYEAPATNSTTCIMAVSGTDGAVQPLIISGPSPETQTWFAGQTATFTVAVAGTQPITNIWLVRSNNSYVTLTNGVDANGSTISGANTTTLTISDLTVADGTNYIYLADNVAGQATSIPVTLIVSNDSSATAPMIISQNPPASVSSVSVFTNLPTEFEVVINAASPPVSFQWYNGANPILNATNPGYVFSNLDNVSLSCLVSNFAGTAFSSPVTVSATLKAPLSSPAPYQSALLGYKAVAYWPLNETNGNVAYDVVGNNNGVYLGNYTLGNPGVSNASGFGAASTSANFDGSTGYVDIPVNNLNYTGPMSVIAWIQTTDPTTIDVADVVGHTDNSYRTTVNTAGIPEFADDAVGGFDAAGASSVADGNWHQLVGVFDGTTEHIYVDGAQAGTEVSSQPGGSTNDVEIASAPDYANRFFAGNIAQVSILTNALTASEVLSLYNLAGFPPTIVSNLNPPLLSQVPVGAAMTFSVTVDGPAPYYYQWSNQSGAIRGATNSSYIFDAEAGTNSYDVGISNEYGSVVSSTAVVIGETNAPPVINFDNSADWTFNAGAGTGFTPSFSGNTLQLTDGGLAESGSAFFDVGQYIRSFIASFTYNAVGGADGITFCLQNSSAGTNASGVDGGDLGYTDIMPSAAFEMDIYTHTGLGTNAGPGGTIGPGIAYGTNGSTPYSGATYPATEGYYSTGSINIDSGDNIYVQLYYMEDVLYVWLVDATTMATYTTNIAENFPAILGNGSAYIGFTGATGGVGASQTVTDLQFSYTTPPILSAAPGGAPGTVVVSWPISVSTLFTLLQSRHVGGPWSPANMSSLTQVGLRNQVTLPVSGSPWFYQLQLTAPNAPPNGP